jgi:hypothetical protein
MRKLPAKQTATPSLAVHIESRLGPGTPLEQLGSMFVRSFGAGTPAEFWRFWNPVYGYYLYYRCYQPVRRWLSRGPALLVTFAASGFLLHDLPFGWWVRALKMHSLPLPFVALWFVLIGIGVLLTEALRVSYAGRPFAVRLACNALAILLPLAVALWLSQIVG